MTRPTTAARASGRSLGYRHRSHPTVSSKPVSSTAPPVPAGHRAAASGIAAARSPTSTSQRTAQPASQTSPSATGGQATPTSAAASPRTVAGATAGAASRLAGRETRLTVPDSPAISGAVAMPAAALTASASAIHCGHPRQRSPRDHPGASRTMAAVASTERANPASRASPGSTRSRTQTVAASAGTAARERPVASAMSATAPIAAARSTLALGPARTTNPSSARPATPAWARRSSARRRKGHSTPATTMATFAPDTAVRCDKPARRNCSTSTGSMPLVSPTTRPGSSPAARSSSVRCADPASPLRTSSAPRWIAGGSPTRVGGPRADSTATTSSPGRGRAVPTRARTGWPGAMSSQPSAGANSSTAACSPCRPAPSTIVVTVASATARMPRPPVSARARPSSSRTTMTVRPDSATAWSGELSRATARTAANPPATASPPRTARSRAAVARRKAMAASPADTTATPASTTGAR
jgi:hypothetical protein